MFATAQEPIVFPQGANSLFMGHSFFIPIAEQFDKAGKKHYPKHNVQTFKKGGEKGSPLYLWENHKQEIEAILNSTDIDLFGMVIGPVDENVPVQDLLDVYSQWFDLAISYNPETSFFIGLPWSDFPSNYTDADAYATEMQQNGETVYPYITLMRDLYPNNDIYFLNYGIIAGEMRILFEQDELVGILRMIGNRRLADFSIFVDEKGHGGTMLKQLAGLSWLYWFYGTPPNTIVKAAVRHLGWDKENVIDILQAFGDANKDYQLF